MDPLSRSVFLASSRDAAGRLDFAGLLPEQVQGFGLGVMAARAAYWARQEGIPFSHGRVYGPHGRGLVVANHRGRDYDPALSQWLTRLTQGANLQVRALGFKPYIAPGLSSAAVSLIQLLRVTQAAQDGVHGAGDGLGRPILLLVLEEDLPTILAPEEGELSLRQGTGEGLGGQGLTVCVKYAVGAGGRCRDHGGMEGGLAGPIGDLIAGVPG